MFAYVGSRTTRERNARGDGINVYRVDAASGALMHVQLVGDVVNPSFLALDRGFRTLYTVHGDAREVSAFRIDPADGTLAFLNRQSTEGLNPVHLALDPSGRWMVIANHLTSTLALLPIQPDGALGPVADLVTLEGEPGPHRVEQPFAKPHQVVFDPSGQTVVVPDKGVDRIFAYRLDPSGHLRPAASPWCTARSGAGPRHLAFSTNGRFAYVLNELDSTVMSCRWDATSGELAPFQILPALPDDFTDESRAAEIEASRDGRFIYASNRGHDSIATFAADPSKGRLRAIGWTPAGGRTPRFFALSSDGRFMYVANEDSDTIRLFAITPDAGLPAVTDRVIPTGSPVCIVFRTA